MFKELVLHFYNSANVPLCPCPDIQQAHELIASLRLPDVRGNIRQLLYQLI